MSTPSSVHRSPERSTQVAFRVTPQDRAQIRNKAAAYGMTLQDYLTWKALELDEAPVPLRDGRKPRVRPAPAVFEERLSA